MISTEEEAARLERACAVADASSKSAEEWSWITALLAFLYVDLKTGSWMWGAAAAAFVILFCHLTYSRRSKRAWDAYERGTGTGKYFQSDHD